MSDLAFPDWTSARPGLELHRGLYALGLEAVGAGAVARRLLPGLPSSILHARYFSFLSWAFWTQGEYLKARHVRRFTGDDQRAWLHRLEHVMRAATIAVDPDVVGLTGRRSALVVADLPDSHRVRIVPEPGTPSAFVPAAYSASFTMLGCGQEQNGIVYLTEVGESLALAYDAEVRATEGAPAALREVLSARDTVSVGAIRTLQAALAIRPVSVGEPEHGLLIDLLFRTQNVRNAGWGAQDTARSRCLALLLDVVRAAPQFLTSPDDIHTVFATGHLPNDVPYSPPLPLTESFNIWTRYQERQTEKLGLHGLWHATLRFLGADTGATGDVIVGHLKALVERSDLAAKWVGAAPLSATVADAEKRVLRRATRHGRAAGYAATELIAIVRDTTTDAETGAAVALVLLLLATASWRATRGSLPETQARFHEDGGRERIALGLLTRDADARATQSLGEYLAWLIECCVLSQSMAVALEKLARGDYRFFILREDDGFRVVRPQDPDAYLAFDASRLGAAFSLLTDLCLVDDNEGYRLTPAGRATLRRILAFHTARESERRSAAAR